MGNWLTKPLQRLRKRVSSQAYSGLVVDRSVYTDLHSLTRIGRSWEALGAQVPRELVIETTNICNANCVFCAYQYQDQFRAGKGVMSDEVFEKALHDYAAMGGKEVNFTPLVGDALVDPKIITRIQRAKQYGFRVFFYTNGILLNKIDLEQFLASGVDQVMISTAPLDRESHENLYRSKKYDELRNGVHRLLRLRKERGDEVEINITFRAHIPLAEVLARSDFQEYVLPFLTESEIEKIDVLVRRYDSWGGLIKPDDLLGEMQIARAPRLKFRPCAWTFVLMVMYDGKVRACSCRFTGQEQASQDDGLLVGDLREESLADIWGGERLSTLRESFGKRNPPAVCRSCTMYRPA